MVHWEFCCQIVWGGEHEDDDVSIKFDIIDPCHWHLLVTGGRSVWGKRIPCIWNRFSEDLFYGMLHKLMVNVYHVICSSYLQIVRGQSFSNYVNHGNTLELSDLHRNAFAVVFLGLLQLPQTHH